MRLTESVEQMNLRAAAEIKAGNEDSARQLIKEKRNVMAALELSKKRAALLEEFATKLNQVISLKETRLMASLSLGELSDTTTTSSVRIVPPKDRVLIVPPKEKETGRDDQCSS
ncbi:uncharacterized protein LOC112344962 [Selaginella moellendorffii]|uniref:uncharacterized protein LOC112344962 n=1 Tax=Selaginella moellendorffii TaxID=88036 RepID=UPI000D1CC254|nr:uncharacterized protein LOC112344962 [Selaginella moellendorffii]|eukprot:XP_024526454.1 uncharacterized protein LOC112344962 [Selaginella moellendorffii]